MDMSKPPETTHLSDLICFAVYSAGHVFNRVYKPMLRKLGLIYPQYLVMIALWREDGRCVGQAAHARVEHAHALA